MTEELDFEKIKKLVKNNRYHQRISELKGLKRDIKGIEIAVKGAIDNLSLDDKSFIIYGDPQSGKTEMMIALTAKLLDRGAKIIIHLITDHISLLNQNLKRFANSGIDPTPRNFDSILDENIRVENNEWVIFCKKNSSNLKKLIEKLKDIPNKIIIDDEADYATPNSRINFDEEQSKINELTEKLIGVNGVYIGVTATPARLDLNNTHKNCNEKWIYFSPHSKYNGPDTFFPLDNSNLKYTLNIIEEREDYTLHLEEALIRFLINVAHLNIFEKEIEENYSFLIHNSGMTKDHAEDEEVIQKVINLLRNKENPLSEIYYKKIFRIVKDMYPSKEQIITEYIAKNIGKNEIIVMNSKKAKREENVGAKPKSLFTIVIGGNIVSRGVTFENLLSMFFTRSVKNKFRQDTYIQRARMFGAREDYLKYFELTIPEELYLNWHDCFIFHRLSLESIKSEGQAPTWIYGNRVIPTGPTAIDRSTVHIDSGEMGFEIFEYENKKELEVILKVENPLEVIQKLKEKYGKEILPDFLIKYISHLAQTPLIKISGPTNVKTWKEVDKNRLIRKRGFISTSSSGFYDFDHHIQIVFHPDSKKARVYYKPTSRKIGFLKNLENNEKFKFKRERDELKLLEKETPRFEVLAGIRGSGITFEKIDEMNRRIIELKKLLGGNNKKTPKGLPKENPIKKIKENSREELLQKAKGVIQEVKEEQTAPK